MEILWKIICGVIGYILGGLTVHLYYKSNVKNTSAKLVNRNGNNTFANDGAIVATNYHSTVYNVSGAQSQKIPEPSKQAKLFIAQMIDNQSERIVTYEPAGVVDGITIIEAGKEMVIEDKLSVPDDLEALKLNGYLRYCQQNSTGYIYALTPKGREYGKSLFS